MSESISQWLRFVTEREVAHALGDSEHHPPVDSVNRKWQMHTYFIYISLLYLFWFRKKGL